MACLIVGGGKPHVFPVADEVNLGVFGGYHVGTAITGGVVHDPDFAAFHRKLKDAGKKPKVVRVALARKLLVRLNAKARDVRAEFAAETRLAA